MLLTCAMQVHNRGATAADQNTIGRLQLLGILPPTDSWNKVAGCAPPSPPGAPATAMETDDGAASEAEEKKPRSRNRQWWLDPPDADWRKADWVTHDPARARIIKVMGDKKEWIELPPVPTRQLLAWHDKAQPGDAIKGVTTDLVRNHAYDYTYEADATESQLPGQPTTHGPGRVRRRTDAGGQLVSRRRQWNCTDCCAVALVRVAKRARAARMQRPAPCTRSPTCHVMSINVHHAPSGPGNFQHGALVGQESPAWAESSLAARPARAAN